MEDRLQAIETALASLRAALVPGDRGQAAPGGQTEDKARVAAHRSSLVCTAARLAPGHQNSDCRPPTEPRAAYAACAEALFGLTGACGGERRSGKGRRRRSARWTGTPRRMSLWAASSCGRARSMPGWSRSRLWSALRMQRTYRFCKGIHGRYGALTTLAGARAHPKSLNDLTWHTGGYNAGRIAFSTQPHAPGPQAIRSPRDRIAQQNTAASTETQTCDPSRRQQRRADHLPIPSCTVTSHTQRRPLRSTLATSRRPCGAPARPRAAP